MGPKDAVTEIERLRAVPPGLKRGIRLSAEKKNREPTSAELDNLDGCESDDESPVIPLGSWGFLKTHGFPIARSTVRPA